MSVELNPKRLEVLSELVPQGKVIERDSLIRAKISLIARFNSLHGRKISLFGCHRELTSKALI